jgi:fibronectin type 3 domain-containing protein
MKSFRLQILTILIAFSLAGCGGSGGSGGSGAGMASLKWVAPTENTDDSELIDLSGYNIYYGDSANQLVSKVSIVDPSVTEYVVQNLNANTLYYFAITSVNSLSIESAYSNIVSKQL